MVVEREFQPTVTEVITNTTRRTVRSAPGIDGDLPLGAIAAFVDAARRAGFADGDVVDISGRADWLEISHDDTDRRVIIPGVSDRVTAGAAFADGQSPGWWAEFDDDCDSLEKVRVLVFGESPIGGPDPATVELLRQHGMSCQTGALVHDERAALIGEWKAVVRLRRELPLTYRARSGAALLDKVLPDWRRHVDVDRLDMSMGADDLLAQIYSAENGYVAAESIPVADARLWALGFAPEPGGTPGDTEDETQSLRKIWRDVIIGGRS